MRYGLLELLAEIHLAGSKQAASQTANLYGLDLLLQDDGAQTRTLLTDGLGSVRQEMAGSALETATTYEPYGNILAQTGTSGTTYAFTGEQFDGAAGLLYLRARYYNPGLKLFMSKDRWRGNIYRPVTLHGYLYVRNNPARFSDPPGLDCIDTSFGQWCYTTDGGQTVKIPGTSPLPWELPVLSNPQSNPSSGFDNLTGYWDILIYRKKGGFLFYIEQSITQGCDLLVAAGGEIEYQQRWQGKSLGELIANRRAGNYSEEINATGFLGAGIQVYGEASNVVGTQPDAVVGLALGYKEVAGIGFETSLIEPASDLSAEISVGVPDSVAAPGASFTLGVTWQLDHEIMVAVPSRISVLYSDKNRLAEDNFRQTVERGKYRYVRPLPGSPIFAPEYISIEMWHRGYDVYSGMRYPFAEWEDGWPPWEQPSP